MYKSKRVLTFIIIINLLLKYPNGVKVSYTFYISLRKSRVGTVIIVIYAKKNQIHIQSSSSFDIYAERWIAIFHSVQIRNSKNEY